MHVHLFIYLLTYPLAQLVRLESIKENWLNYCIDQSKPDDINTFNIKTILPLIMREDSYIQLVNDTNDQNIQTLYVTEIELKRIWNKNTNYIWNKNNNFNAKDALLLIDDEEDVLLMGDDRTNTAALDQTIFVTENELKRIYNDKYAKDNIEYNEMDALLLLEDDGNTDDGYEYVPATEQVIDDEDDESWDQFIATFNSNDSGSEYTDLLQSIRNDLEDTQTYRPAWKKDRHILTPDIDTQVFTGDIMNSNTYLTTRIPANWDDPEEADMAEAYVNSNTMAWPGEEETDYNVVQKVWERLGLPEEFHPNNQNIDADVQSDLLTPASEQVDWNNFDYGSIDTVTSDTKLDVDKFFSGLYSSVDEGNEDDVESGIIQSTSGDSYRDASILSNWKTPPEWLENVEFKDHVGYEVWSKYDTTDFEDADDTWSSDDHAHSKAFGHILDTVSLYLTDHTKINQNIDEYRYWSRMVDNQDINAKEEIPGYLTPDKDRGIEYSDEIIEMKGKITLHPKMKDLAEEYKDDVFTHNEDLETMNKIGSIREQYDWQPSGDESEYAIDKKILAKIQPVIKLVNHIAELKSTKNNKLVFQYKGVMRHLIGIRSMMMTVAKECFPEMVDLRLETTRTSDKFDR